MLRFLTPFALALSLATPAQPHPHVFVDTGLEMIFDDTGKLAAVRVTWVYDELFSLVILEDKGFDQDYDGKLTDQERAELKGFDMDWPDWFEGDLFLLVGEQKIPMSGPMEITADFADARIFTTHVRALDQRIEVGKDPVVFQIYDPGYYTAYEVSMTNRITGRDDCQAKVFGPDLDAAMQELQDALAEFEPTEDLEEVGWPAVGANFAEEVRLSCDGSS